MGRFFTKPAETARAGCSAGRAGRIHPHGESVKKACHCEEGKARRGNPFLAGAAPVPPPFDKGGCWMGLPWVHTPTAGR